MPTLTPGNDNYNAPLGFDSVDGAAGTDTIIIDYSALSGPIDWFQSGGFTFQTDSGLNEIAYVNFERVRVTGGTGDDDLRGLALDDILRGGLGNDTLSPGIGGSDSVDGGVGIDQLVLNYSAVAGNHNLTLGAGAAIAIIATTNLQVQNVERVSATFGVGNDTLNTAAQLGNDDAFMGDGDDVASLGLGRDTVDGWNGTDTLILDYATQTVAITRVNIDGTTNRYGDNAGLTNTVDFARFERFNVTGGTANDVLSGGTLGDTLVGGGGNDTLNGGAGVDSIVGGGGVDLWQFDLSAILNATVNLVTLTASNGTAIASIEAGSGSFGGGNDAFTANADIFNDTVFMSDGNDTVSSGRGFDDADGWNGDDLLIMNWGAVTTAITWTNLDGTTFRFASGTDQLDYRRFERYELTGGSAADSLIGGASTDTLIGGNGNDTLNAATGDATVNGGVGLDTWVANLQAETGAVIVSLTASQTTAQGTAIGQSILGIEAFNLSTGIFNDSIDASGFSGSDNVFLNDGDDVFVTGLGRDTLDGWNGVDRVVANYGTATTALGYATDPGGFTRFGTADGTTSVSYIRVELFSLTGGTANDDLRGAGGDDSLNGGGGNDTLNGAAGGDTIVGGGGRDTWIGNLYSPTLATVLTLSATGGGSVANFGTSLATIENIELTTGDNNDVIDTSLVVGGNDTLSTNGGNDTLILGDGRGTINTGGGFDVVNMNFSTSTTSIRVTNTSGIVRFGDTAGLNEMFVSQFEAIQFTGGGGNDRLIGFGNADSLAGGNGNDVLNGGGGDDVYTGGAGNDVFRTNRFEGIDLITDAAAGDVIRVGGFAGVGGVTTGNGTTVVTGQVQRETITLVGGGTETLLYLGFDGSAGADVTIRLSGTYANAAFNINGSLISVVAGTSTPGGVGADTLIGSAGNDFLSGLGGNDRLEGQDGNDTLSGGTDIDTLIGGLGRDELSGGSAADVFLYTNVLESQAGTSLRDLILDLTAPDRIDLSAIDANLVQAGDQAFAFIGTAAFSGASGQLRDAGGGVAEADVNGDGLADWQVQAQAFGAFAAANFIL